MADSPSELQLEIEKLERKHAEHPEGRFFVPLANAYRKLGDVETAEALLRAGVDRHPDYLSAHIVLGRCLADRGAISEAEDEFRFVLAQDPQNLIALRTLGELAAAERRTGEAAEWYRELLAVDPLNEEARHALEALGDAPATPEAETEFRSGAGWWEAEPEPAESPDAAAAFTGGWQGNDVEEELGGAIAPSTGEEDAMQWGGYDDLPGLRADHEPLPQPAPGAQTHAELHAGGDLDLDQEETGENEVVTETIAELYSRQGLHDRAAAVYRELIRRRGGDPALERRLAEAERLAGGEADAAEEPGLVIVPEATGESPEEAPEESPEEEFLPALAPTAGLASPAEAAEEPDAFADSFADGFPSPAEDPSPATAGSAGEKVTIARFLVDLAAWKPRNAGPDASAEEPSHPAAVPAPDAAELDMEPTAELHAAPEPFAQPEPYGGTDAYAEPGPHVDSEPAAEAGSVAGFEPVTGPEATAEPLAFEAPEPLAEWDTRSAAEDEEDDSLPLLGGHPEQAWEHGTGSAGDDEPFPWETPGAGAEREEAAAAGDALPVEGFYPQAEEEAAPYAAPGSQRAETPAEAPREERAVESTPRLPDEDEDLESFQAWLRSLKR